MYQCPNCGGQLRFNIPTQQLACENCQSEFDPYQISKEKDAEEESFYDVTVFKCPQCGGEIVSSDNTAANFCTFCGASTVLTSNLRKEKRPGYIIPFTKTKEDCKNAYAKHMRRAWFAPKELKDSRFIDSFRGIYMPYWAYHITEEGPVSLSASRSYRRGDYIITDKYSVSGDINSSYKGISYDASSSFDDQLSQSIAPYDVRNMNRFTPSYLCGFYADTADVDPDTYTSDAIDIAATKTYDYVKTRPELGSVSLDETAASAKSKFNPKCKAADGAMFPVWFMSYRNKDRVAYATVNGQTGKVVADMPVSISKYIISSLILAIPVFVLLNAFLTLLPSTTLGLSAIVAALVCFLYSSELNQIMNRDMPDFPGNKQSGKHNGNGMTNDGTVYYNTPGQNSYDRKNKKKKKNSSGAGALVVIIFAFVFIMFSFLTADIDNSGIFRLATYVAVILSIAGSAASIKPYSVVTGRHMPATFITMAAVVVAAVIQFTAPVSDLFYYAGAILCLAAVIILLLGVIKYYNVLSTRKLPQFINYSGGDDRA